MKLTLIVAGLAFAAVVPREAQAFDYAAHCRMSNRALRLAANRVAAPLRSDDPRRDSLFVLQRHAGDAACRDASPRPRTFAYGEWVAQVDWATSPADFFVTPVPGAGSNWSFPDTVPVDAIRRIVNLPMQDYRVLHENCEHFGATALYSFQLWHTHAIQEAGSGRLNAALVYQAFADHYLEDLFAPGHIFSPRSGLNDVLAGGIHNAYNRRGAFYNPDRTSELSAYVSDTTGVGDKLQPSFDSVTRLVCNAQGLVNCVRGLENDTIPFYGDNQLGRSAAQELFITLVIARSLEDVLRAWAPAPGGPPPSDTFEQVRWCGYDMPPSRGARREWTSPNVVLPFGHYYQEERRGLPLFEPWPAVRAGFVNSLDRSGGSAEVSTEKIVRAWPANWTGAPARSRLAAFREDRTTTRGIDLRIPVTEHRQRAAVGVFERRSASLNRINVRTSYLYGARLLPWDQSVEPHLAVGAELGFSVLHFEVRPSVGYNTRHGVQAGVLSGISIVFPGRGTKLPPEGTRPRFPREVTHPCR